MSRRAVRFRLIPALLGSACLAGGLWLAGGFGTGAGAEEAGGTVLRLGLRAGLEASDNPDFLAGGSPAAAGLDGRLSLGLSSRTRTQSFRLDLEAPFRTLGPGGGRLDSPSLRFSWQREAARSRLSLDARYRRDPLRSAVFDETLLDEEFLDETDISAAAGTRITYGANARLETGIDTPLGLELGVRLRGRDFEGPVDPGVVPTRSLETSAALRLRLSPVTDATLRLSREEFRAEDALATRRSTDALSLGISNRLASGLVVDAALGQSRIVERTNLPALTTRSGATARLGVSRPLRDGSVALAFDLGRDIAGERSTLRLTRVLDLPRGGLSASLGVTRDTTGTLRPVGRLALSHELPRGQIGASLEQRVATTDQGNEVRATRLGVDWRQTLSPTENLAVAANYLRQDGASRRSAGELRVSYNRALTPDWTLSAGYSHRVRDVPGSPEARANTVFLTLGRDFSIRP